MKASLFCLPSIGSRVDIEKGMAGLRGDLYQKMLTELTELIKMADDLGYESVSFTEHHFHIEGFEVSNNPVLLDLYFAMQTKRIRVGQLGIVLPAQNPIRVAEDIAMLDHMSGGRACAGFARGYQRRWVDVMAQQTHGVRGALPHEHDQIDAANREAFEENFQIIKKCWTEEMLTFDGKKVPDSRHLPRMVVETPIDREVPVQIWRDGKEISKTIKIAEMPESKLLASADTGADDKKSGGKKDSETVTQLGMGLTAITAEARQHYQLGDDVSGVLVTSVTPDSTAAEKQLTPGDVLLEVNQQEVRTPKDVVAKVDAARKANKKSVLLLVQSQGGDSHFVALPVDTKGKG